MACINSDTRDAWQQIANGLEKDRPYPGRRVRITKGRKHLGKVGTVMRHQLDKFSDAYRWGNDASHHMKDMRGRSGWCVQVRSDDGGLFWCKADYCECDPKEQDDNV